MTDLHFYHERMNNNMDMRGFKNIEAMHEHIIWCWNNKVRKNDEVVIIGDFSMGTGVQTNHILKQLNGKKYLVIGNHDHRFLEDKQFDESQFVWIKHYAEVNDDKRKVVLHHSPIFCYPGQYRVYNGRPKTYMLYGHVHNSHDAELVRKFIDITRETKVIARDADKLESIPCHMINCFCMRSDYTPLTLDEWIELEESAYGIS